MRKSVLMAFGLRALLKKPKRFLALVLSAAMLLSFSVSGAWAENKADIVFLVDYSGSMSTYISQVAENLTSFSIALKDKNIDANFAVIQYEDAVELLSDDNGNKWTSDPNVLSTILNSIKDTGWTENLNTALEMMLSTDVLTFRNDASRFAFVLTDEVPTDGDSNDVKSSIINELVSKKITTSVITDLNDNAYSYYYYLPTCKECYTPLCEKTGGKLYDIRGDYSNLVLDFAENIEETIEGGGGSGSGGNYTKPATSLTAAQLARAIEELGLEAKGERVIASFGPINVTSSGTHNFTLNIDDTSVKPGSSLFGYLVTIIPDSGSNPESDNNFNSYAFSAGIFGGFHASTVMTPPTLTNTSGDETNFIPDNLTVDAASSVMTSDDTYAIILTTNPSLLPVAEIEILDYLSPDIIENIANTTSIDRSLIIVSSHDNTVLSDPKEPTDAMRQFIGSKRYTFEYKMKTITVSDDGYYVFKVKIPDELVNVRVSDLGIAALTDTIAQSLGMDEAKVALINPINGFGAFLDGQGFGLDKTGSQVLALLSLQAGEPFSVYLLKIILMLFGGGCDAGIGLRALGLLAVSGVLLLKFRKRK